MVITPPAGTSGPKKKKASKKKAPAKKSKKNSKKKKKSVPMDGLYPVSGPKSRSRKKAINNKLKELYYTDGITYTRAASIACCSRQYAARIFWKLAEEIAKYKEESNETWIEKNDRVRDRALEGLSIQLEKSNNRLQAMKKQIKKAIEMQEALLPNLSEKIANEANLGQALGSLSPEDLVILHSLITDGITTWKNYGYYVQVIGNNIRSETTLNLEVQQQYDTIEILPPPSEILNAEIERRIADRQGLAQPVPSSSSSSSSLSLSESSAPAVAAAATTTNAANSNIIKVTPKKK